MLSATLSSPWPHIRIGAMFYGFCVLHISASISLFHPSLPELGYLLSELLQKSSTESPSPPVSCFTPLTNILSYSIDTSLWWLQNKVQASQLGHLESSHKWSFQAYLSLLSPFLITHFWLLRNQTTHCFPNTPCIFPMPFTPPLPLSHLSQFTSG